MSPDASASGTQAVKLKDMTGITISRIDVAGVMTLVPGESLSHAMRAFVTLIVELMTVTSDSSCTANLS